MTSLQSEDDNDPAVVVIHKAKAVVEEEPVDAPEASEVASDQKNDENKDADKASDEKEAKDKEENYEEMSIDTAVPDLENEAKDSDDAKEEYELFEPATPDWQKKNLNKVLIPTDRSF